MASLTPQGRLSSQNDDTSLTGVSSDESHVNEMLARFGSNRHTFNEHDRAKAVEVRRRKAAERKAAGRSVLEVMAERAESEPDVLVDAYFRAAKAGDWKASDAIVHNLHGRPAQRVTVEQGIGGIDPAELTEGDIATLERVILERIQVQRRAGQPRASADDPAGEP